MPKTSSTLLPDGIRQRTVRANNLDFPVLEAGSGPLVLCMHGFPDHARSWIPLLKLLADAGYWAVAPFMRGFWPGGGAPDGSYRAAATGLAVLALISSLGRTDADLIGHDFGARAVYAAASLDPTRVRKLVGLAVPHGPQLGRAFVANGDQQRRSWYMFFFQTQLAEVAVPLDDYAFIDRLWREWSPGFVLSLEDRAALHAMFAEPGVLSQTLSYYRQLFAAPSADIATQDLEARASCLIQVPSLYLHGAQDNCMSPDLSDGIEAVFSKGLQKIVLPGVGHFLHLEQPEEVAKRILEFLKS
ncbi:alpha/beta hydrolase [Rhizobium sp. SG570]|uniref:alpha/beta fold hydrolase n=1 Tax=Rhizobium sp. SG570 TaxID=2587113 RepID=UPI0014451DFB|nr:alpha/beta hydrolase [Rhizobium sp. SG570]NKJ40126.1 pimeloyl-ACP methyl ester carboxylesterase [Rhizobium sp. SG570]